MHDRVGTRIGKYQLTRLLGRGGMGVVYEGMDLALERSVAVKLLPPNPQVYPRFLREARTAARVSHPNVVAVYDVGKSDDALYLVMELVRGVTAQELVSQRGPLSWETATQLLLAVCRGLKAAHAVGLIHRDIKPANILCSESHEPRLADFGLAKPTDAKGNLTQTGTILGTPEYMSPEQCRGETLDERTDLYSLGAVYFFLLTGKPPYTSPDRLNVLFSHCSEPVPDPRTRRPGIPEACALLTMKALAKKRADRFADAEAMIGALEALGTEPHAALTDDDIRSAELRTKPVITLGPRRRGSWHATAAAFVVLGVIGLFALFFHSFFPEPTVTAADRRVQATISTSRNPVASVPTPTTNTKPIPATTLPTVPPTLTASWFEPSFALHRQWYLRDAVGSADVVRYLPDGGRILMTQGDRKLAIAEPPSNRFTIIECSGSILAAVTGGRNGEWIAVATNDGKVRLLATPDGKRTLGVIDLDGRTAEHLATKGVMLAVATTTGVRVYDVSILTSPQLRPLSAPAGLAVTALAFAPEGPILAGLTTNRQLDTWDVSKNAQTNRVNLPGETLLGLAFGRGGQAVVLGRSAGKVESYVFEQLGNSSFRTTSAPEDAAAVATIGQGHGVAFAGKQRVGVYDPFTEKAAPKVVARLPANAAIRTLHVSRNGRRALCGFENGLLVTFDADAPPKVANAESRDRP